MANTDQAHVAALLDKARDALSVGRVFGPPVVQGDVTVIPVARVVGGGGGGSGSGPEGHDHDDDDDDHDDHDHGPGGSGGGAGGGFGGIAQPVGVYVIRDGEVTWEPAVHPERLALAGMALVAFALLVLRSILRRP